MAGPEVEEGLGRGVSSWCVGKSMEGHRDRSGIVVGLSEGS